MDGHPVNEERAIDDASVPSSRRAARLRARTRRRRWTIAAELDSFRWEGDEDPERVKYLLYGLYTAGLATEREAARGHAYLRPAVADEFHFVLVREVLEALEHESDADAHFVKELRDVWGVARDC